MRTEKEIREHRDALRYLRLHPLPCGCAASGHAFECQQGGLLMAAAEQALSWALGEYEAGQRVIDEINETAAAARCRRGGPKEAR